MDADCRADNFCCGSVCVEFGYEGDCPSIGGGGGGSCGTTGCYCTSSNSCYDGYYCKFTNASSGTCQPIPDCSQGCTNCDTTAWTAYSTGYQSRVYATCDCTTCSKRTQYRCAAGYYGTPSTGTSGCTKCPSSGTSRETCTAGSTSATSCYLPASVSISDAAGKYQFTTNCFYTN